MAIKVDHKVDFLFKKYGANVAHRVWSGGELAPSSEINTSTFSVSDSQIWTQGSLIPIDDNPLNDSLSAGLRDLRALDTISNPYVPTGRKTLLYDNKPIYEEIVIPLNFQSGSQKSWSYDFDTDSLSLNSTGGANIIPFSISPQKESGKNIYQYELGWNSNSSDALNGIFTKTIAVGHRDWFFDTDGLVVNFFGLDDSASGSFSDYFGGDNTGQTIDFLEGGTLSNTDTLYIKCWRYVGAIGVSNFNIGNGLTNNSSTIELGGELINNVYFDGSASNYDFTFGDVSGGGGNELGNFSVKALTDISLISSGTINIDFTSASTITDSGTNGGIRYAADYSNNYVDRSLIDKGYLDTRITLTPNVNISSSGNTTISAGIDKIEETYYYTLQAGSGSYTHNLILDDSNSPVAGTIVRLYVFVNATNNPSLLVRNLVSDGDILYTIQGDVYARVISLEFIYDGNNWYGINKEFETPKPESVLGAFLSSEIKELDQIEVNDGGHSTTRNDVNGLRHYTRGSMFRHTEQITISTTGQKIFDNLVTNGWYSGSGASPNSSTDYFLPAGSLKKHMLLRWTFFVESLNTSNGIIPQYNGTNLLTGNGVVMSAAGQYRIIIDMVIKEIHDSTGTILTTYTLIEDGSSQEVNWNEVATLDTVNDAYVDFEVFRDTDDLIVEFIDMEMAG